MGKVPGQLSRGGGQRVHGGGLRAVIVDFERTENEGLVLLDRSAERRPVLILDQSGPRSLKEAAGVEIVVAEKFPQRSMKIVGPLLADNRDIGARVAAGVGGEIACLDLELLNGIRRRDIQPRVARRVHEVSAVEGVVVHVGTPAVDVHPRPGARIGHA